MDECAKNMSLKVTFLSMGAKLGVRGAKDNFLCMRVDSGVRGGEEWRSCAPWGRSQELVEERRGRCVVHGGGVKS